MFLPDTRVGGLGAPAAWRRGAVARGRPRGVTSNYRTLRAHTPYRGGMIRRRAIGRAQMKPL